MARGVDTVKLSYPLASTVVGWHWVRDCDRLGWLPTKDYGTKGPLWWCAREHEDGPRVTVKGVGRDAFVLWEGSVPKALGLSTPVDSEGLHYFERYLRGLLSPAPGHWPFPTLRRVDLTHDLHDPDGLVRVAARNWNPHERSRYVEAVYQGGETVWQHNKSRGVRVYDKGEESGLEVYQGVTRIEYQCRGAWAEKLHLNRLSRDWDRLVDCAMSPVVDSLLERVQTVPMT